MKKLFLPLFILSSISIIQAGDLQTNTKTAVQTVTTAGKNVLRGGLRVINGLIIPVTVGVFASASKMAYDHVQEFGLKNLKKAFESKKGERSLLAYLNSPTRSSINNGHYNAGIYLLMGGAGLYGATWLTEYATNILNEKGARLLKRISRGTLAAGVTLAGLSVAQNMAIESINAQ